MQHTENGKAAALVCLCIRLQCFKHLCFRRTISRAPITFRLSFPNTGCSHLSLPSRAERTPLSCKATQLQCPLAVPVMLCILEELHPVAVKPLIHTGEQLKCSAPTGTHSTSFLVCCRSFFLCCSCQHSNHCAYQCRQLLGHLQCVCHTQWPLRWLDQHGAHHRYTSQAPPGIFQHLLLAVL